VDKLNSSQVSGLREENVEKNISTRKTTVNLDRVKTFPGQISVEDHKIGDSLSPKS
jgi:hypothetical protein